MAWKRGRNSGGTNPTQARLVARIKRKRGRHYTPRTRGGTKRRRKFTKRSPVSIRPEPPEEPDEKDE